MKTVSSYFPHRVPSYEELEFLYQRLGTDPESLRVKARVALEMNKQLRQEEHGQ